MFIRNLDKSPFAKYVTQIGDKLYYVTFDETDGDGRKITKPLTDFMKLHISPGENFFVCDKKITKNNDYCLKNIVVFINEECKGDAYIIDIPGRHASLTTLYIIFSNDHDRVAFKLKFNGFTSKQSTDAFK